MTVETLRIVQLNAGSLLEPDWEHRRDEIVAWVERLEPDVVCLQEIWESATHPNTAGQLVERLGAGWSWVFEGEAFGGGFSADPTVRFGSAVLSRWPIDAHEYHRLPVADDPAPFVAGIPWEAL